MKFSREYEASIISEWKGGFLDYKCLKKLIKKIKITPRDDEHDSPSTTTLADYLFGARVRSFSLERRR
jgi:SPX domain protein involved in polyphosphate accumulation